jgi:hypothetical protein
MKTSLPIKRNGPPILETTRKFGITWWEYVTMRTIGTLFLKREWHGICKECLTK